MEFKTIEEEAEERAALRVVIERVWAGAVRRVLDAKGDDDDRAS